MEEKSEKNRSIFTRESLDYVASPEKLDDYIRIAGPGIWILIVALLLTVAAVFYWGFTGSLPKSVTVNGVVDPGSDNHVVTLVDASEYNSDDLEGKEAVITLPDASTINGVVEETSVNPVSANEMMDFFADDWMSSKLITSDYAYLVVINPEEDLSRLTNKVLSVSVITDEVKPISFLFS